MFLSPQVSIYVDAECVRQISIESNDNPQTPVPPRMHVNPIHINLPDARAAASRGSWPMTPLPSPLLSANSQPIPSPVFPENAFEFLRLASNLPLPIGPHIIEQAKDMVENRLAELYSHGDHVCGSSGDVHF